jgi:hypothetical protein
MTDRLAQEAEPRTRREQIDDHIKLLHSVIAMVEGNIKELQSKLDRMQADLTRLDQERWLMDHEAHPKPTEEG